MKKLEKNTTQRVYGKRVEHYLRETKLNGPQICWDTIFVNEFYYNSYAQTSLIKVNSDGAYQIFEKDTQTEKLCT